MRNYKLTVSEPRFYYSTRLIITHTLFPETFLRLFINGTTQTSNLNSPTEGVLNRVERKPGKSDVCHYSLLLYLLLCASVPSGDYWSVLAGLPCRTASCQCGGRRLTVEAGQAGQAGQAGHRAGHGQVGAAAGQPRPLGISVSKFTIRFS